MPSTSDARFTALRNLGYEGATSDMLHAWLKDQTGASGSVSDLWRVYLNQQGTPPGARPDRWHSFLALNGFADTRAFWLAQGAPAPIGCAITLTGDDAAAFGGVPADITGQTFSVTSAPNTTTRIATTGLATPIAIASGKRIVESGSTSVSGGTLTYLFLSNDAAKAVTATWTGSGWSFQAQSPAGSTAGIVAIAGTLADTIALGVDADTGDALAFITSSGVTTAVTGGTFDAAASGLFSGKTNFALGGTISPTVSASSSGEYVTSAENYAGSYTGLGDLCGTALPEAATYPLDDDGTVAGNFSAGFAAATAPDYQTITYDIGTAAVTAGYAITAPSDPFGDDLIGAGTDIVGFEWEGVSLSGAIADYDTADFSTSIVILANSGAIQTVIQLVLTDASGNMRVEFSGAGDGAPSDSDVYPSTTWVGAVVGVYVNGSTGGVGWILNDVDQGYLTDVDVGNEFAIALITENASEMHTSLDNRTVVHRLRTAGLGSGFPAGTKDVALNDL